MLFENGLLYVEETRCFTQLDVGSMAALIPDEKYLVLLDKNYFWEAKYTAGYYPESVMPSTADGVPAISFCGASFVQRRQNAFLCDFKQLSS